MKKYFSAFILSISIIITLSMFYVYNTKLLEIDDHSIDNIMFEIMEESYYGPIDENDMKELMALINNSVKRKVIIRMDSGYKFGIRLEENGQKFNLLFNKEYVAYSKEFKELDEEYNYYFYKLKKDSYESIHNKVMDLNSKYHKLNE